MNNEQKLQLVRRFHSGDPAAEKELFLVYKDPIYWKVSRHIKTDIAEIKDVVSEVYLAILQGLRKEGFDPDKWISIDAFIYGITNNKIRDWFKKKKTKDKYIQSDPLSEEISVDVDNSFIETDELKKIIKSFVDKLETKFRIVLTLRYYRELSIQEISKEIGIPPRRVSERINYALKLMRKECDKRKNVVNIFDLLAIILM